MSKEALASAHEMSIGGTHNFCIAGGADDCITHKHPTHDRRKKKRTGGEHGNHFIKKKKTAPRSDSFNRQVEAEKQSMRLLHTVLWTEGVELPVTKIFKWALSSSSIPPIKRKVIVTKERQNDATRNGDEGLSRIRERKRKENLQMEVSAAFHRIQLIRNHHFGPLRPKSRFGRLRRPSGRGTIPLGGDQRRPGFWTARHQTIPLGGGGPAPERRRNIIITTS